MESLLTLANNSDELTSHHADLLQTVSDLRSQLERTVERIQGTIKIRQFNSNVHNDNK